MIKIDKTKNLPSILVSEEKNWTKELLDEINSCGSFNKLPDNIKTIVSNRYKHSEIKDLLIPKSDTKCAFCESIPNESGYIEIEHFFPKAIYPDKTYDWANLLPSCKRCNLKKLSLDTGKNPIVKPDIDNPEDYFSYDNIKIVVKKNAVDSKVANRTIERLDLNQFRLIKPRSEFLVSLVDYESKLEKTLKEFSLSKAKSKKTRLINNILESLDILDDLKNKNRKFSGFCQNYINNSKIINKARIATKQALK